MGNSLNVAYVTADEPDEVTVVKKALAEHLDMDPKVTLGVLCDQIVPGDEPMDPEDKTMRDRLRTIVLAFIAGEAKRAIVERHASQAGSEQERIIINGLFKVIRLDFNIYSQNSHVICSRLSPIQDPPLTPPGL